VITSVITTGGNLYISVGTDGIDWYELKSTVISTPYFEFEY